jgi:hypothetical protein
LNVEQNEIGLQAFDHFHRLSSRLGLSRNVEIGIRRHHLPQPMP